MFVNSKTSPRIKPSIITRALARKTQLAVALTFAVVGGGFASHTYAAPATTNARFTRAVFVKKVRALDNVTDTIACVSTLGNTKYGGLAYCVQMKPKTTTQLRAGFYSPLTRRFSPMTGWKRIVPNRGNPVNCSNMNYAFAGTYPLATASGPQAWGQIYRTVKVKKAGKTVTQQQVKWARITANDGKCRVSGGWRDAQAWSVPK
jgi:hypothetical protein